MKSLFRQKQWIVTQAIFALIGVMIGIAARTQVSGAVGGLGVGLQFISKTDEYVFPVFLIFLSDLAFTVEYLQGTFLTHLSCGQSRKRWMLKKSLAFYLFVLLQTVIALSALSFFAGIGTGHFGLEGATVSPADWDKIVRILGLKALVILVFVSFGVFITTLMPGRPAAGNIAAIGIVLLGARLEAYLYHVLHNNVVFLRFLYIAWMQDPDTAWTWGFGCVLFVLLVWASAERVQKIEIPSRGV